MDGKKKERKKKERIRVFQCVWCVRLRNRANEEIYCGSLADSNDRLFDPIGWIVGRNAKFELVAADYVTIRCIKRRT